MSLDSIIALMVAGLLLLLAEVFVPGGVLGMIGAAAMAIAVVAGFVFCSQTVGLVLLVSGVAGGLFAFWAWLKFFPRSPFGKRLILSTDERDWKGFEESNDSLVGREGVCHTTLRPAGAIMIDGKRVAVETQGEMIRRGRRVRVIEVEGNRIVVAEVPESEPD